MEIRDFRCVSVDPPVYVYVYQSSELTSNSSVSLLAWDKFAAINNIESYVDHERILKVDLEPFFVDNAELVLRRKEDELLSRVVSGVEVNKCGKYTFANNQHRGVGWDESVWSKRLYHCILEQEDKLKVMGITIFDLSNDGPNWTSRLSTILHCHKCVCQCTPFKGVTDFLLIGRKSSVVVLTTALTSKDVEHISTQKFDSGVLVTEISIAKPKLVDCKLNGEQLPSKLSELLSSMYLIGVLSSMDKDILNLNEIIVYGWLVFRGTYSFAVKLIVNTRGCFVDVLWTKANLLDTMSDQLDYFINILKRT